MPQLSARGRVIRDAMLYTPPFLLAVVLLAISIASGAIIGIVLLGILTFLFGYQSIQALRDLRSEPQQVEGVVTRRWTKRDALVAKSYYIRVERTIFHIQAESYLDVRNGDTVRVVAYPHTGMVVSVERLSERKAPEQELDQRGAPSTSRRRSLRTARATPSARRTDADTGAGVDAPERTNRERTTEGDGVQDS